MRFSLAMSTSVHGRISRWGIVVSSNARVTRSNFCLIFPMTTCSTVTIGMQAPFGSKSGSSPREPASKSPKLRGKGGSRSIVTGFCGRHPTGKSVFATKTCPALSAKIFRFRRRANQFYQLAPSFPGKRGASRSSRTRDGMRWTRQRRRANGVAGRVSRERSTGARTNGVSTPSPEFGGQHMVRRRIG